MGEGMTKRRRHDVYTDTLLMDSWALYMKLSARTKTLVLRVQPSTCHISVIFFTYYMGRHIDEG